MIEDIHFKCWFYLKDQDLCVGVPAKCGGTAFYRGVFNVPDSTPDQHARSAAVTTATRLRCGPFSPYEVMEYHSKVKKLLAIRKPTDRFASLWRDKHRSQGPMVLAQKISAHPAGDPHWYPQYLYHVPGCELVNFARLGTRLGYDITANVSQRRDDDPMMPEDLINTFYAQDHKLWQTTTS